MSDPFPSIALLGGTFDPIHLGHIAIAKHALLSSDFQQCLLIPCFTPIHKAKARASVTDRLAMLESALAECSEPLAIETCEIESKKARYTLDTLKTLREKYRHHALTFIVGADGGRTLTQWQNWRALLEQAHILIMPRDNEPLELDPALTPYLRDTTSHLSQNKQGSIVLLKHYTPLVTSSTQIRDLIKEQQWEKLNGLLPSSVIHYIQAHRLYQT